MQITRQIVADQIGAYLSHQTSLEELVNWAELQMMEAEFESTVVRDAVARLGVADVRAFGLTGKNLSTLGYAAHVQIGTA